MSKKIFVAERDGDDPVVGTSADIADVLGVSRQTALDRARMHMRTRDGWMIRQMDPDEPVPETLPARIFRAERENDDPIIGDAEEIAALTGYCRAFVYELAETGKASFAGWRVTEITDEEEAR